MKTERKEKKEIVIKEECIYKGFVIFKCSKYYYYNGYKHVIITYRSVFSDNNVGYYVSIASAKRAITKRTKKNNLNNQKTTNYEKFIKRIKKG